MTWMNAAVNVIDLVAQAHPDFTSDDVRAFASKVGMREPWHYNEWGAAYREAARRGVIRGTGLYQRSKRQDAKGRAVRVWVGSH